MKYVEIFDCLDCDKNQRIQNNVFSDFYRNFWIQYFVLCSFAFYCALLDILHDKYRYVCYILPAIHFKFYHTSNRCKETISWFQRISTDFRNTAIKYFVKGVFAYE